MAITMEHQEEVKEKERLTRTAMHLCLHHLLLLLLLLGIQVTQGMRVGGNARYALGAHGLAGLRRHTHSAAARVLLGAWHGTHGPVRPGLLHAHHGARLAHVRLAGGSRHARVHHGLGHVLWCRRHARVGVRRHARMHARLRLVSGHHRGDGCGRAAAVLLGRRRGSGRVTGLRRGDRCIGWRLPHPLRTTPELERPGALTHAPSRQGRSCPR